MSLKNRLIELIKLRGQININELESNVREWRYKISNAERRLRECELIEPIKNAKRYIIAYKWRGLKDGELANFVPKSPQNAILGLIQGNKSKDTLPKCNPWNL